MNDSNELLQKILETIEKQSEMLARLCQVQEAILILMADEQDPDAVPNSYLSGKPL